MTEKIKLTEMNGTSVAKIGQMTETNFWKKTSRLRRISLPSPSKAFVVATCNKQNCQNSRKELLLCNIHGLWCKRSSPKLSFISSVAKRTNYWWGRSGVRLPGRSNWHSVATVATASLKWVPKKLKSKANTEASQILPIFMYLLAKLFCRPMLKTLKFIKTKTLWANYRKIALTIGYLGLKALRTPGKRPWSFRKKPWAFAPRKRPSYATAFRHQIFCRNAVPAYFHHCSDVLCFVLKHLRHNFA